MMSPWKYRVRRGTSRRPARCRSRTFPRCGAVTATVQGGEAHGHIANIVACNPAGSRVGQTSARRSHRQQHQANAKLVADQIKSSQPMLSEMAPSGKIAVRQRVLRHRERGSKHIVTRGSARQTTHVTGYRVPDPGGVSRLVRRCK